ncbi:M48 family metalloprotease [Niallia endozanthoxylica]|uniref:Uncharacterized protein n=1 Tax=Niallia endozanthoxylica TaxID=2036016 RepID=A0A5J5HPF4_9BACI|nr:hypothetical protein [Niallia endozanthoxylica]KAA9023560.1 hypothetical protein F4V44_12905 [Niallia endozanthoxylica]
MNKYVMDQFFEDNPNNDRNWLKKFTEDTLNDVPENVKDVIIKEFEVQQDLIEELDLWYSNDVFIHLLMSKFIDEADELTRNELKEVYIGKKYSDEANATAHNLDPSYKGYLISFNFELEYQLFNLSEVFAAEILLCITHENIMKNLIATLLVSNIKALPNQSNVGMQVQKLLPEQLLKQYSDLSIYAYLGATAFIVAHEIGHHFLKHTDQNKDSILPFRSNNIRGGNINHEYEFAADEYALSLMLKSNEEGGFKIEYLAGPLIAILTLALEDECLDKSSDTHPSLKDRFFNIKDKIKSYCSEEEYETLFALTDRIINYIHEIKNPWNGNKWWV